MSNGENWFETLFKLWAMISKMVLDGARKASEVAKYLQRVVDDPQFINVLNPAPIQASVDITPADWREDWQKFYQEVFGFQVDFSQVELKDNPGAFGWAVLVAQGLTLNQAWAKCRDRFPCNSDYGDDLDKAVPHNDRTSATAYAKRFRNRVEADEENKSKSANMLAKEQIQGNTLLERLLLGLWYNWRTGGGQLDLLNWTLCAGSRLHGGGVPCVCWGGGQLRVGRCHPDDAGDGARARSAV